MMLRNIPQQVYTKFAPPGVAKSKKTSENLQSANFYRNFVQILLEARTSRFFPVYDLLVHGKFTTSAMSFLAAYDANDLHTFPPSPSRVKQKSLKI